MDFFYVGTIALNYWMQKYYNRDFKKNTDVDISSDSLTLNELKDKYPYADTVPLLSGNNFNIFKFNVFNNDGMYIEDNGIKYATPEYLLMTYYARYHRTNCRGKKFLIDFFKIKYLKEIIFQRGYLDLFIDAFKKLNYDYRIFFPLNHYIYRIMCFKNDPEIIGGEYALLCHAEMQNKIYNIQSLDIHIFNANLPIHNINGSLLFNEKESVPYIEYDGLKIQTIESIKEKFPELEIPDYLN